ncbi:MAG: HAD family hydrolase [Mycobacteriaceae bacterium]|uniref:HAD family hydrolase n=1 Tax=Corynebacterium sp. TaxID=1720 RepID=UPI003F9A0E38
MKIAAFDFDGTILFEDGISDPTLAAIRAWQDKGNLAVAATGKSLSAARFALEGYDVRFDYSVLFTGAVVAGPEWDVLHRSTLAPATVQGIVDGLSGIDGIAVYGTMLGGRDVRFSSTIPDESRTSVLSDFREMATSAIDDQEFVGVPVRVPGDKSLRDRIHGEVTGSFDVGCVINQNFVDIVPVGTSKAAGLDWLVRHLGVSGVPVYTFGDSWNDLPMHAVADRSFSFPWSPNAVKDATDEVIGSVAEALPRL